MALNINPIANQLFTGVSTAGGFSFRDMKELGFFEPGEPVSFGSCFLDYTVGVGSDPYDPIIGVSTFNAGIKSTGTMSPLDLIGAVRELKLEISGSGQKVDLRNLAFGSEQTNNIRKTIAITTSCVISSDDTDVAALSLTGGYNNLRIFVDGQVLGCGGTGGGAGLDGDPTDRASDNGRDGGNALDIVNSLGIAAKIAVSATGAIKAGGGGGGAGEDGLNGVGVRYKSGTNTIQNLCNKGCNSSHCGNGTLAACYTWDPFRDLCECRYDTYSTSSGGIRGLGGAGGRGRGADFPSGSRDGLSASDPGLTDDYGGTAGTPGGAGGNGGDYGQPGERGQYAPPADPAESPDFTDSFSYGITLFGNQSSFNFGFLTASSSTATVYNGLTGVTSIYMTGAWAFSNSPGSSLYNYFTIQVRRSDGTLIASGGGGGFTGNYALSASLDATQTYYVSATASAYFSNQSGTYTVSGSANITCETPIPAASGANGPGNGGQPGFAITGAYGLSGFVAGIITGILPEPTFGFTTSANATVGYAGTQEVWEFTSIGSTEISLSKTQRVDLLVVGGGSQVVSGSRGGGGGRVEYRQLLTFPGGEYTVSVGNYGQSSSIAHVDGTSLSITANGANSSSSQGAQVIVYDGNGNESGNEVSNTVYPSQGSGGDSVQVHGPEAYGGGGGATSGGQGGSHSGGVCWRAYPGGGDRDCGTGPYSSRGGNGGNGLQVNVRISQTNEYYGSGGGGAAGESGNCNGPDCGVSVTQGAMGPGQYGRGRRPSGQNHGSPINATQGILVIKYLDNLP